MPDTHIIDMGRSAILVTMKMCLPLLLLALVVGLIISLFQALTQIQETTLTFVPKLVAVLLGMLVFMPIMFHMLHDFSEELRPYITGDAKL